ncbi:uncharacterized protein LOC131156258 isoform X2 [Malania oleifera]|uniref:uncharacterized protein LOC131156258 isoform X2 n=1 Tax=Malania oleifera TaxID=397392 RepID=UPI0025AE5B0F|nr:uncharacterized protein LOC131156258 isoform X2 [Malania oleifera]XP_057965776.1 uncharacterized protein LOC131156258 isoform X2 [Malania oleifera]XP_057965777.1 uncharacterized protein LOC131156258 isoform X2 [Malania oleifera]XP_057965779.1 uncharacterized protein LOC131156258 isoform X2 [Malania oleifera]XP_057965780.1 uncharacterized protein LOC131156258 isoform X2 [Malania oleifera]XP_057965781.1 uncharacterized protein LOC131156258 isoform X2 [Malania oleifera]XP_057965782.1 uncharac
MSTRGTRASCLRGYVREPRRRRMALDLDLNHLPPNESGDQEGTSSRVAPQELQPALIDVDAIIDDDVVISSPRAFAEAKNNARRQHGTTVVHDVESGEQTTRFTCNNRNKRRRVPENQTIINCDLYINLEGSNNTKSHGMPPPPPPPKEPTFSCPICMGPLVEEMSTKCGHIFCKKCIKAAVAAQSKCPTCRKRITMKDTIRVYLPAMS